jgi:hypothetical protein
MNQMNLQLRIEKIVKYFLIKVLNEDIDSDVLTITPGLGII